MWQTPFRVDKKYETAIEAVTPVETSRTLLRKTSRQQSKMIAYLKQNRLGCATFLPLTSVTGKDKQ